MVRGVNRSHKTVSTHKKSKTESRMISGSKTISKTTQNLIPPHTISGISLKNRVTLGSKTPDAKKIQIAFNKIVK